MQYAWTKLLAAVVIDPSGASSTPYIYVGQNASLDGLAFRARGTSPDIKIEVIPNLGTQATPLAGAIADYTDIVASSAASFTGATNGVNSLYCFPSVAQVPPAVSYTFTVTNLNAVNDVTVELHVRRAVEVG